MLWKLLKMRCKEHCAKSKELFGEEGESYHKWIDSYAALGYRHRLILHHKEGIEVGIQLFGEKARKHLEQHVIDDYSMNTPCIEIPTIEQLRKDSNYPEGFKFWLDSWF